MKNVFICMLAFLAIACNKDADLPTCIETEIESFKSSPDVCETTRIDKFTFQDNEVYVFDQGNCVADGAKFVKNADCVEICVLGTIAGNTICNGVIFDDEAIFIENIWESE